MEAALLSLLAPVASGRRYYVRAPQGEPYPYLVLNRVSGIHDYTMGGPSGFVQTRVQIDVYSDSWPSVFSTAQAAQTLLSGFSGVHGSTRFQGIFIDSVRDLSSGDAGQSSDRPTTPLYRISIDIMIHHTPA